MRYREESSFLIRLDLAAEFPEEYEGDDDGYAWLEEWKAKVKPAVVRAVFEALRRDPRFFVVPTSRGKDPEKEVEVQVTLRTSETRELSSAAAEGVGLFAAEGKGDVRGVSGPGKTHDGPQIPEGQGGSSAVGAKVRRGSGLPQA